MVPATGNAQVTAWPFTPGVCTHLCGSGSGRNVTRVQWN